MTPLLPGGEGPVLVREYQPDAPAGLIGEWMTAREIPWRTSRREQERLDPAAAAAIVTLGSSASAFWAVPPWIADECEQLRGAIATDTPVLGICFGAQALAVAAGGSVARAPAPEVGWVAPDSAIPALNGPYLAWHFDAIELPPGARELARSPRALQAYALGPHLGLQFHPEVTPEIWSGWAGADPATAGEHTGEAAAFRAALSARAPQTRARVFALLDWWRAWLAEGHAVPDGQSAP